jgi:hypothetical protein
MALLGKGGVAVAKYETVYYGTSEGECRAAALKASQDNHGQRVLVARADGFVFTETKVASSWVEL